MPEPLSIEQLAEWDKVTRAMNCDHLWEVDPIVIDTNPETLYRVCQRCSRVEINWGKDGAFVLVREGREPS